MFSWSGNSTLMLSPFYDQKLTPLPSFETECTDRFKAEWRKRPEVPTTAELMRDVVDLPMNVIDGPYQTVDEYLETHYELLREDAFSGLRDAVGHMRKAPDSDDTQDVAIYENVSIYEFAL